MADEIHIRSGDFHAEILLDELPALGNTQIRKLFKLMFSNTLENREAIEKTNAWLPQRIKDTTAALDAAKRNFTHGWRAVPNKKSRDKSTLAILKENTRLKDNLKQAKTEYDRVVKIQNIFNEF
jgi:hypothetical protein